MDAQNKVVTPGMCIKEEIDNFIKYSSVREDCPCALLFPPFLGDVLLKNIRYHAFMHDLSATYIGNDEFKTVAVFETRYLRKETDVSSSDYHYTVEDAEFTEPMKLYKLLCDSNPSYNISPLLEFPTEGPLLTEAKLEDKHEITEFNKSAAAFPQASIGVKTYIQQRVDIEQVSSYSSFSQYSTSDYELDSKTQQQDSSHHFKASESELNVKRVLSDSESATDTFFSLSTKFSTEHIPQLQDIDPTSADSDNAIPEKNLYVKRLLSDSESATDTFFSLGTKFSTEHIPQLQDIDPPSTDSDNAIPYTYRRQDFSSLVAIPVNRDETSIESEATFKLQDAPQHRAIEYESDSRMYQQSSSLDSKANESEQAVLTEKHVLTDKKITKELFVKGLLSDSESATDAVLSSSSTKCSTKHIPQLQDIDPPSTDSDNAIPYTYRRQDFSPVVAIPVNRDETSIESEATFKLQDAPQHRAIEYESDLRTHQQSSSLDSKANESEQAVLTEKHVLPDTKIIEELYPKRLLSASKRATQTFSFSLPTKFSKRRITQLRDIESTSTDSDDPIPYIYRRQNFSPLVTVPASCIETSSKPETATKVQGTPQHRAMDYELESESHQQSSLDSKASESESVLSTRKPVLPDTKFIEELNVVFTAKHIPQLRDVEPTSTDFEDPISYIYRGKDFSSLIAIPVTRDENLKKSETTKLQDTSQFQKPIKPRRRLIKKPKNKPSSEIRDSKSVCDENKTLTKDDTPKGETPKFKEILESIKHIQTFTSFTSDSSSSLECSEMDVNKYDTKYVTKGAVPKTGLSKFPSFKLKGTTSLTSSKLSRRTAAAKKRVLQLSKDTSASSLLLESSDSEALLSNVVQMVKKPDVSPCPLKASIPDLCSAMSKLQLDETVYTATSLGFKEEDNALEAFYQDTDKSAT